MKGNILIEPEYLEIVKEILNQHLPNHSKVWVFGSRTKGKIKKFSDLDLAVDVNHAQLPLSLLADLAHDFDESALPYKVDIVDWNTINNSFKNLIAEHCILIWEK
ncbi:MAG: nucleotidyltransferase family protein [Gammaproteobacteria bacterium]